MAGQALLLLGQRAGLPLGTRCLGLHMLLVMLKQAWHSDSCMHCRCNCQRPAATPTTFCRRASLIGEAKRRGLAV